PAVSRGAVVIGSLSQQTCLDQGCLVGLPRHQHALDPGGELRRAEQRHAVPEQLLVPVGAPARADHLLEVGLDRGDLRDGAADQQVRHDRGGGTAHRAAVGVVGEVLDPLGAVLGQVQAQRDLVPAGGIDVVDLGIERFAQPGVQRALVVLDDELGVQGGERGAHARDPKKSTVWATPATKASTSSAVVWTEKLARVVPCSPKRRWSGQAQWWPTRTSRPRESSTWPTSCG